MPISAPPSLTQELLAEVVVELFFVVVADGQVGVCVYDDTVLVDLLYLLEVDDVAAVDAHEVGWQVLLHLLHREQGDYGLGLAFKVQLEVLAHALNVAYVADGELHHFVVGLDEDGVVVGI